MTAPAVLCAATTCSHLPAPGARLCPADVRQVGEWLAKLDSEYRRLTATPSLQGRQAGTIGRSGLAAHHAAGDLRVMDLRDRRPRDDPGGVLAVLGYWADGVRAERQLVRPTRRLVPIRVAGGAEGPVCDWWCAHPTCAAGTLRAVAPAPRTVGSERKILADHLDWIVAQDAAGQFFDQIRVLWGRLRAANGTGSPSPVRRCRQLVDGVVCGGTVRLSGRTATCSACGHATTGLAVVREHTEVAAA